METFLKVPVEVVRHAASRKPRLDLTMLFGATLVALLVLPQIHLLVRGSGAIVPVALLLGIFLADDLVLAAIVARGVRFDYRLADNGFDIVCRSNSASVAFLRRAMPVSFDYCKVVVGALHVGEYYLTLSVFLSHWRHRNSEKVDLLFDLADLHTVRSKLLYCAAAVQVS